MVLRPPDFPDPTDPTEVAHPKRPRTRGDFRIYQHRMSIVRHTVDQGEYALRVLLRKLTKNLTAHELRALDIYLAKGSALWTQKKVVMALSALGHKVEITVDGVPVMQALSEAEIGLQLAVLLEQDARWERDHGTPATF